MIAAPQYFAAVQETLSRAWHSQTAALDQAADWMATALAQDRCLYVFGTGHSHLLAEEVFYRAGGLAQAAPILEEPLMLHESASESTGRERESGYARRVLARYPATPGDVLVVASNSGRNAVPIEIVELARAQGLRTIALTSLQHSRSMASRHASGKRLFEVADLTLDNGSVPGDACVPVPGIGQRMGPTSTIVGAFLLNALMLEAAARAVTLGWTPAIYESANTDGAAGNADLLARFRGRIRHL
ncbi:MAG: SIS domain-containing protein [Verrucomicrobia bacterium]|nr:SIS domain-containing protein [Verrucomicrobiota bacterium]MBI3871392.1 SIS domain-containing protein [Verrucomicrobiota bacterium]